LHWITRRAPFGQAHLIDEDITIDFQQETTAKDIVTIIATLPLTINEQWQKMPANQYLLFHKGERIPDYAETSRR